MKTALSLLLPFALLLAAGCAHQAAMGEKTPAAAGTSSASVQVTVPGNAPVAP